MAQIEIGQLPLTTSILNSTQIPVENANVTQKIEATALKDYVSTGLNVLNVSGNLTGTNVTATQLFYGNLSTGTQSYITQLGNLTSITSNGNITTLSNVNVDGNVHANFVIGNGSLLTGLPAGYSNANVDAYLPAYTGNIAAGNVTIANTLVASGNTRVGQQLYVVGQSVLESTTRAHGNLVAAAETLSTNATTGALVISGAGGLGVGGAIFVAGNISTSSNLNVTANINASANINVTANINASANINVTRNITASNISAANVTISGNITSGNIAGTKATFTSLQGSGALLTNIPNSALVNSAITINGSVISLGGSISIAAGVVSITGTANQITANVSQGNIGLSLPQNIATASGVQFGSFGVGTAASGTTGEIRATNNITAYFSSDARYKENVRPIPAALDKVLAIGGKLFTWTDEYLEQHGGADGYFIRKNDFGVVAQDVAEVFPEAVRTRPDGTLAVDYEKLSALAFAAIGDLHHQIQQLKSEQKS
jgi:hypothetical protein